MWPPPCGRRPLFAGTRRTKKREGNPFRDIAAAAVAVGRLHHTYTYIHTYLHAFIFIPKWSLLASGRMSPSPRRRRKKKKEIFFFDANAPPHTHTHTHTQVTPFFGHNSTNTCRRAYFFIFLFLFFFIFLPSTHARAMYIEAEVHDRLIVTSARDQTFDRPTESVPPTTCPQQEISLLDR